MAYNSAGAAYNNGGAKYAGAQNAYRETRIKTAGQGQLIVMLYDGAVKNLDIAIEYLKQQETKEKNKEKKDPVLIEKTGKAIIKAQEILSELSASLDFENGADIAKTLFALYSFFNQELLESNISGEYKRIETVRDMLIDLRNTWVSIGSSSGGATNKDSQEGLGISIAG